MAKSYSRDRIASVSVLSSAPPESAPVPCLQKIRIAGFRTAEEVVFEPLPMCALIGEPGSGKSNLLTAVWTLLEPLAPPPASSDARSPDAAIWIEAELAHGRAVFEATPSLGLRGRAGHPPPAIFLPASLRSTTLAAPATHAEAARTALRRELDRSSSAAPALVESVAAWIELGVDGTVLLIEEPELFLRPQAQRYLYRLLRQFAAAGNQVLYSTHSAPFVNVARLEELVLVRRGDDGITRVSQPGPLPPSDSFRVLSEFDAERSELLLAKAVLLVEGMTEKLAFPFLFRALGHDADREGISVIECGGKPNLPFFIGLCNLTDIPYVVVHDRDARPGKQPIASERALNATIRELAGPERVVVLERDFEAVASLHGHSHKAEHALHAFAAMEAEDIPRPLADAVNLVVAAAHRTRPA
jgi:predicted ATPase